MHNATRHMGETRRHRLFDARNRKFHTADKTAFQNIQMTKTTNVSNALPWHNRAFIQSNDLNDRRIVGSRKNKYRLTFESYVICLNSRFYHLTIIFSSPWVMMDKLLCYYTELWSTKLCVISEMNTSIFHSNFHDSVKKISRALKNHSLYVTCSGQK
jgi:hypothetical protein